MFCIVDNGFLKLFQLSPLLFCFEINLGMTQPDCIALDLRQRIQHHIIPIPCASSWYARLRPMCDPSRKFLYELTFCIELHDLNQARIRMKHNVLSSALFTESHRLHLDLQNGNVNHCPFKPIFLETIHAFNQNNPFSTSF